MIHLSVEQVRLSDGLDVHLALDPVGAFLGDMLLLEEDARAPTRSPQGGRARQNAAKNPADLHAEGNARGGESTRSPAVDPDHEVCRDDGGARVIISGAWRGFCPADVRGIGESGGRWSRCIACPTFRFAGRIQKTWRGGGNNKGWWALPALNQWPSRRGVGTLWQGKEP
jgi:hypothetical protein